MAVVLNTVDLGWSYRHAANEIQDHDELLQSLVFSQFDLRFCLKFGTSGTSRKGVPS